jgi:hypothetical protein
MERRRFLIHGAIGALAVGRSSYLAGAEPASRRSPADDESGLREAVRSSAGAPQVIPVGKPIEISEDFSMPPGCSLEFGRSARISVRQGVKLTVAGPINAGEHQIFDGPGTVMGGQLNGAVQALWFGAEGDDSTDNAASLLRMREFLRHSPGKKTITFRPGVYRYSRNDWGKGIADLEINGKGARFLNVGSGRTNFEQHPFVSNWGMFSPGGYGPYAPAPFFYGYPVKSCKKGATTVSCAAPSTVEWLEKGAKVLIYGYGVQRESFPPNARYFEYNTIASYDRSSGEVRLERPLRYDYDERWYDFKHGKGAPRILPLRRPAFHWGERLVINDCEFLRNPSIKGNATQLQGFTSIVLNRVNMHRCVPTMCQSIRLNECKMDDVESDKLVDELTFHKCDIGDHYAASGVNSLSFTGGTRIRRLFETSAPNTLLDDVELSTVGFRSKQVCMTLNPTFAMERVTLRNARFVLDRPGVKGLMNGGGEISFLVEGVLSGRSVLVRCPEELDAQRLVRGVRIGFRYTTQGGGKSVVVSNVYRHDDRLLAVEGEFTGAPQVGDTYRGGTVNLIELGRIAQAGAYASVEPVIQSYANKIDRSQSR